jgi:hypothetical protein
MTEYPWCCERRVGGGWMENGEWDGKMFVDEKGGKIFVTFLFR